MNHPYTFQIKLELASPFNTASSEPGALGIDSPLLRDHRQRVLLPGTLVQGRVVEELRNWGAEHFQTIASRLGVPATMGNYSPNRKTLVLGDFVLDTSDTSPTKRITRVSLHSATGTADPGALQVIETPALAHQTLSFTGQAQAFAKDATEADHIAKQLQAVLNLVPNLGAERAIGFGRVLQASVKAQKADVQTTLNLGDSRQINLLLELDRPFVLTDAPQTANGFESVSWMAGNAIKGAFADTCKLLGLSLPTGFDAMVFKHGLCTVGHTRPRPVPASLHLVKLGNKSLLLDLAHQNAAVLLKHGKHATAPQPQSDWKADKGRDAELNAYLGRAEPQTQLRVRTAIDDTTGAAAEAQLFAYQLNLHETKAKEKAKENEKEGQNWQTQQWHVQIDTSELTPEQWSSAKKTLQIALQFGLYFLGKTKAIGKFSSPGQTATPSAVHTAASLAHASITLTLQTPALLLPQSHPLLGNSTSATAAHQAYAAYFGAHGFTLMRHFASQSLRGGKYLQTRFGADQHPSTYTPWVLTNAGSVFVLQVADPAKAENAAQTLNAWQNTGLPPAHGWPTHWQQNPYIPQNGFGEVVINDLVHAKYGAAELSKHGIEIEPISGIAATPAPQTQGATA